jgi:hypothetical protein
MFEAGKKYRFGLHNTTIIYTCIWANEHGAVVQWENYGRLQQSHVEHCSFNYYEEYVEPKVHTTERYVICNMETGGIFTHISPVSSYGYENVGLIRISHTEGQGLAVEVVG